MLTKVLYEQRGSLELDPNHFKQMIENADSRLQGLFDKLVKALVPDNRSAYNKVEAKKTIVSLCYIMAGMRNKFVNDFKLEVGLYLSASGATRTAIDTINSIGRTDLPGGNPRQIIDSIESRLQVLPEQTRVLPGHGQATTIGA